MTARIDDNIVMVANYATDTSRQAAEKVLPKTGTIRRQILSLIAEYGGLADFEIERIMKGKHQTISAGRRSLVIDGFIVDSGTTRENESGNRCTVWNVPPVDLVLF